MKTIWGNRWTQTTGVWGLALVFIAGGIGPRGAVADDRPAARSPSVYLCDPVCELQSQDKAFALLLEVYRQYRSYQIESDFESRLRAALGLSEDRGSLLIASSSKTLTALREWVLDVARQERQLRMGELSTQVLNFRTAYDCSRHLDMEEVGQIVASQVDTRAAARRLKTFQAMAVGVPNSPGSASLRIMNASTVLFDAVPVAGEKAPVEPCD